MYACVCMYVCMYVCIFVCMCACVSVCLYTSACVVLCFYQYLPLSLCFFSLSLDFLLINFYSVMEDLYYNFTRTRPTVTHFIMFP